MLKGVNQWCFPSGTPLKTIFATCQTAGIDVVELNLNAVGDVGLTMETSTNEAKEIGKLAEAHDISLPSLSTGLFWKYPLSSPDPSIREKGRDVLSRQLELANMLGMDTILVVPGAVTNDVSYDECYKRSQEELAKMTAMAEEMDVHIGIENVWNKFLLSPLEMARYVDELDSSHIGVYFDVGNVLQFGFPEQWIRILGERIRKIHVKDFKSAVGNINGFVNLLSGDVNWEKVRKALQEIGYTGPLTAELSPYAPAPHQLITDISNHIDVILGKS